MTIFPSGATGATGATGGTEQLSASVSGSANGAVTWDLPGSATTGTIVSTGAANAMYTAPNTVATYGDAASSSNRQRVADWSKRRARSGVRWGAEEKTIGVAKIIR